MTNSRLTDPEVLEWRYPVRVEEFRVRRGSGGAGAHRGGDGVVRRLRFLEPLTAAIVSSSRRVPPFGLAGGLPARPAATRSCAPEAPCEELPGVAALDLRGGRRAHHRDAGRRRLRRAARLTDRLTRRCWRGGANRGAAAPPEQRTALTAIPSSMPTTA